jgi:hypothetical protein
LARLYFDERLSSTEISKQLGLAPSAITRRLDRAGYKLREPSQGNLARGSRLPSDQRVPCKLCPGLTVSRMGGRNGHLWGHHKLTTFQYRDQFPGAPLLRNPGSLSALLKGKAAAQKPARRTPGRPEGRSKELQRRIDLAAAFRRLGWTQSKMSGFIYPDTDSSAYANTRNLFADHRSEIMNKADNLSLAEAEELIKTAGADPAQHP